MRDVSVQLTRPLPRVNVIIGNFVSRGRIAQAFTTATLLRYKFLDNMCEPFFCKFMRNFDQ